MQEFARGNQMVSDFLVGSATINRMREEIKLVVNTLISMVDTEDIKAWRSSSKFNNPRSSVLPNVEVEFSGPMATWVVSYMYSYRSEFLTVQCVRKQSLVDARVYSSVPHAVEFSWRDVVLVHGSLGVLMEGMIEEFPFIEGELKIFWGAGK